MSLLTERLTAIQQRLKRAGACSHQPQPVLVAVSKTQPAQAVAELASAGQRVFGENYVQEAQAKMETLAAWALEWHLIGHLQSNKAELAARLFDWVQTVDRPRLATALARHRPPGHGPLNVLIQVNIDDEASKHGCTPGQIGPLAAAIVAEPMLRLRGLMAIPAPHPTPIRRQAAFARTHSLFQALQACHPGVDTLSMGMSEDAELAIKQGASMVRIATALFGARAPKATGS